MTVLDGHEERLTYSPGLPDPVSSRRAATLLPQRITANSLRLPIRDASIACIVTSPPYNVAIPNYPSDYPDHVPWKVYAARARAWSAEFARVLAPGGRLWLNIQPTVPLIVGEPGGERVNLAHIWNTALSPLLAYRDTITWVQDSFDGACAWGSWCRPSAPNLRGGHELILHYYRPPYQRTPRPNMKGWKDQRVNLGGDWVDLVRNVWKVKPANKARNQGDDANFPAAFPVDIPARCIRLSSYPGEVVLDPFAGRGTTGWAAEQLGRRSLMLDLGW